MVSASGAGTVENVAGVDVSTSAALVQYLRSLDVDPTGAVIERGARNYAGPSCPGAGWSCTSTAHPVVQVASGGGQNTFSCGAGDCVVLQVAAAPSTATNTAKCVRSAGLLQVCAIVQLSSTANNLAVVYEREDGTNGALQAALSDASIVQRATGASNTNTACVYQAVNLLGSQEAARGALSVWLGAHQDITIRQDSASGGNSALDSATASGACDAANPLTQDQTLTSTATGRGSITQNENSANLGANVTLDVEQNQSAGFLGSARGPNAVVFDQSDVLTAIANTQNGPVTQTQSSINGGILGTVNQDSRDISTASATQTETQCEDAASSGLTSCSPPSHPAPTYALTQTQYGPVRKGVGTATQSGNSGDLFTVNQSSTQNDNTGSGQTNVVQGDCSTSGNCTVSQNTDVNGQENTQTQSGSNLNTSTNCTGSSCTTACTGSSCTTITAVSAGDWHTCALTNGGGVECWGDNAFGELGNGTTTDSSTPVPVTGLSSGVVAISAGAYHSCALTSGGGVECWGGNGWGELGDGTTTDSSTPVPVTGLSSGVVAISARDNHTCALTSGGGVECWGYNGNGQLGDGTTTDSSTPVPVTGLSSGVDQISAGFLHTCALTSGGGVECWGDNTYGELGDGSYTSSPTPIAVAGLSSGATAVSAATGGYTCALAGEDGAECWGYNGDGELGNGTLTGSPIPVGVSGLSSGVAAISPGQSHTCALISTGGVECWGDNSSGQLGDGTTTNSTTPVDVNGLSSGANAVSAGNEHSCALLIGGAVRCWGNNTYGQLGDGTTTDSSTPVNVG